MFCWAADRAYHKTPGACFTFESPWLRPGPLFDPFRCFLHAWVINFTDEELDLGVVNNDVGSQSAVGIDLVRPRCGLKMFEHEVDPMSE